MRTEKATNSPFSLGVCFPVWNRPDLFKACYDSLARHLVGVDATILIFDNGSDEGTRELIAELKSQDHRLIKISLPQNMGIPFVASVFSQILTLDCAYTGYCSPTHIMLADADIYFKGSILDMIEILEADSQAGIISGHDSIEHPALTEYRRVFRDRPILVKEKAIERSTCLIMRKEVLAACVPFPHDVAVNVD